TDGITEATDGQGEEFGELSLIEALRQNRGLSCQSILTAIVDEVLAVWISTGPVVDHKLPYGLVEPKWAGALFHRGVES
ncbi:MAG TPA: hypothetical protein VF783_26000, partial [Terriglobales bacterium]